MLKNSHITNVGNNKLQTSCIFSSIPICTISAKIILVGAELAKLA